MKQYATKRKMIGAVQWTGEMTPEMRDLLGPRSVTWTATSLTLGNGSIAYAGDWIYQVFLERDDSRVPVDLAVMPDVQFCALYEVTDGSAPTRETHEENYRVFVDTLDALLVDGLRLSREAHADMFGKRTALLRLLHDLFDDERFLARRSERKLVLDKLSKELL